MVWYLYILGFFFYRPSDSLQLKCVDDHETAVQVRKLVMMMKKKGDAFGETVDEYKVSDLSWTCERMNL